MYFTCTIYDIVLPNKYLSIYLSYPGETVPKRNRTQIQGRIQNLFCRGGGGAQVTNEAEGWGRGSPPPAGGGPGGSPPENFEIFASKWCILSAFLGNQYTFLTLKICIKKRLNFLYI